MNSVSRNRGFVAELSVPPFHESRQGLRYFLPLPGERAGVTAEFSDVVTMDSQKLGFRGSEGEIFRGIHTPALPVQPN